MPSHGTNCPIPPPAAVAPPAVRSVNGAAPPLPPDGQGPAAGFRHFLGTPAPAERCTLGRSRQQSTRDQGGRDLLARLGRCLARGADIWPGGPLDAGLEPWENPDIPSGYTYFAQLVLHDLVLTVPSPLAMATGAGAFRNDRAVRLRLETLYGTGPAGCPHAYRFDAGQRCRLRVGPAADDPTVGRDLGRAPTPVGEGRPGSGNLTEALVADPRNDDNLILAQLTAVFHLLHNTVLERAAALAPAACGSGMEVPFAFAMEAVGAVFRSCIRHDLLPRILHPAIYRRYSGTPIFIDRDVVNSRLAKASEGGLPLEFSHAVGRFGHAMVRPVYRLNDLPVEPLVANDQPGSLDNILWTTSSRVPWRLPLRREQVIQWRHFFDVVDDVRPNLSRRIGPQTSAFDVISPGATDGLAHRDLARGGDAGIWSVTALRRNVESRAPGTTGLAPLLANWPQSQQGIRDFLDAVGGDLLDRDDIDAVAADPPLAFFTLFEAAQPPSDGRHLGPLASVIAAEVIFGALAEAGDGKLCKLACMIYGPSASLLHPLVDTLSQIRSMPALIRFVAAARPELQRAQPSFL
ncbi:hypothetical protein STVA_44510 [Allostella vacuolata]|nr:hypothetical protein STVA_44510 [Stella vacuolata]